MKHKPNFRIGIDKANGDHKGTITIIKKSGEKMIVLGSAFLKSPENCQHRFIVFDGIATIYCADCGQGKLAGE